MCKRESRQRYSKRRTMIKQCKLDSPLMTRPWTQQFRRKAPTPALFFPVLSLTPRPPRRREGCHGAHPKQHQQNGTIKQPYLRKSAKFKWPVAPSLPRRKKIGRDLGDKDHFILDEIFASWMKEFSSWMKEFSSWMKEFSSWMKEFSSWMIIVHVSRIHLKRVTTRNTASLSLPIDAFKLMCVQCRLANVDYLKCCCVINRLIKQGSFAKKRGVGTPFPRVQEV